MNNPAALHFCLLIPCFNDEAGLAAALKHVVYPSHQYAIVIVDDGSSAPIQLPSGASSCLYIYTLRLEENKGITTALNTGLQWILDNLNTPLVARLDCGDICHAQRFYEQVAFLNIHPPVGLLGSWCRFSNANGSKAYNYVTPTTHARIARAMYFRNTFIHPTVMFRTALLQTTGLYPYSFPYAEDYALFWTMMNNTETAILDKILVVCAITQTGISVKNRKIQLQSRRKTILCFGKNPFLKIFGVLKLISVNLIPYRLFLYIKIWLKA
jgi:glycosyltransferase involved in cell wall biosynthesis